MGNWGVSSTHELAMPPAAKLDLDFITYAATNAEYDASLATSGLVVVDVYPKAFGACTMLDKHWYNTVFDSGDAGLELKVVRAQSDNIDRLSKFRDQAKPYFLFYQDGQEIGQVDGPKLPHIMAMIDKHIRPFAGAGAGGAGDGQAVQPASDYSRNKI